MIKLKDIQKHICKLLYSKYKDYKQDKKQVKRDIKEIEIIDGPDIKTYTTVTRNAPSISGAILGGAIAGEAGALVGAATGGSRSYTSERVERNSKVQIKARYTNGHYQETELEKASQRYHEIMVNF